MHEMYIYIYHLQLSNSDLATCTAGSAGSPTSRLHLPPAEEDMAADRKTHSAAVDAAARGETERQTTRSVVVRSTASDRPIAAVR